MRLVQRNGRIDRLGSGFAGRDIFLRRRRDRRRSAPPHRRRPHAIGGKKKPC
jgi:hypothetical protein